MSGSGTTGGTVNGPGNLVVGYNQATGGQVRSGSHNISVGIQNEYTSFGGPVAGSYNTVSGPYASVSGGIDNTASGDSAAISGGTSSTASGLYASITGGYDNTASAESSTVSRGGYAVTAAGTYDWHAGQSLGFPSGSEY